MAKNIVIEFDIKANYDYGDMPLLLVMNDLRNLMSEVKERIIDIYDKPNAALYTTWDIHVYVSCLLIYFQALLETNSYLIFFSSEMGYDLHGWIKDFREEDGINSILVRLMNFLLSHHSLKVNDSDASVRLTIIGVDHQKKKGLGNDITKVQLGGKKHRANRKRPNTRHWRLTEAANSLVTSTSYIAELKLLLLSNSFNFRPKNQIQLLFKFHLGSKPNRLICLEQLILNWFPKLNCLLFSMGKIFFNHQLK